ncbi:hypothetical protein [Streptomyces sp. CB02923]|uniref:hypothetical protein n=1 Tax=Streptomyces sp. CB02923 TaxID=1718985 RepID=UPI0018FF186F|nr:hypothetical protein [Streptomyces sp. CB02923]
MTTRLPDPTPQALRAAQRLRTLLGPPPASSPAVAAAVRPGQDSAPDSPHPRNGRPA